MLLSFLSDTPTEGFRESKFEKNRFYKTQRVIGTAKNGAQFGAFFIKS